MRIIAGDVVIHDDILDRSPPNPDDIYASLAYWQTRAEYIRHQVEKMPRSRERQDLHVKLDIAIVNRNRYLSRTRTK